MEYEVRYYYPYDSLETIIEKLNNQIDLQNKGRFYEKTSQYNHPMKEYDYYSKEIDGRFRLRVTKNENISQCKLSWKRRLKDNISSFVNKEEEVEVHIDYNEQKNFLFIIENVLHMNLIESYERYRNVYENDEIEIVVDEYPFGVAVEIEAKKENNSPEETIKYWIEKLSVDENRRYKLSWDDKYSELCKEQGKEIYNEVLFSLDMPKVE